MWLKINFAFLLIFLACFSGCGTNEHKFEEQLKDRTHDYQDAFNNQDTKKIANFFSNDGLFINPETGKEIHGKEEIQKALEAYFKEIGDAKIEVKINSIVFPRKDEAVEIGTFNIKQNDQVSLESAFKSYLKNNNGTWLIDEIRNISITDAPSQYEHLKELDWLIGQWVDADDDVEIHSSFTWDKHKNFIYDKFSIVTEGTLELEGTQIIGWDPIKKVIRSWIFDSDGGFGEATWTKNTNKWVVETAQTLSDASRASSISIYTPIDANSFTWASQGREVGGILLPDVDPITIVKIKK